MDSFDSVPWRASHVGAANGSRRPSTRVCGSASSLPLRDLNHCRRRRRWAASAASLSSASGAAAAEAAEGTLLASVPATVEAAGVLASRLAGTLMASRATTTTASAIEGFLGRQPQWRQQRQQQVQRLMRDNSPPEPERPQRTRSRSRVVVAMNRSSAVAAATAAAAVGGVIRRTWLLATVVLAAATVTVAMMAAMTSVVAVAARRAGDQLTFSGVAASTAPPPLRFVPNVYHPANLSLFTDRLTPQPATDLVVTADGAGARGRGRRGRRRRRRLLQRRQLGECASSDGVVGGGDSECMLVLYCVIAGGQASGRCSNSIFYTCCYRPVTTRSAPTFDLAALFGGGGGGSGATSGNALAATGVGAFGGAGGGGGGFGPTALLTTTTTASAGDLGVTVLAGGPGSAASGSIIESGGFDDDAVCGQTSSHKKLQRRIIGGDDAHVGEFPWQAHIKIGRQQCGGALVSHHYVLTAAHCVHLNPLRRISVVLGAYDIQATSRYARATAAAAAAAAAAAGLNTASDGGARTYRVVQKKIHPNFAFSASQPDRFDIALLRLDRYVRYAENILPVCLPPRGWTFEGWRATVTGWGKTDASLNNRYGTRVLQKVQVPIITRLECERWHQLRGIRIRIYPEMMCAGYKEGKRDACVGDSGGPMTLFLNGRWTIVGITSAGFGCAQSHQPGIYHQVSVSVDWVLANL